MEKTSSNRDEIWFRSDDVCDEQVSSELIEENEKSYIHKLLESLSDCV